MTVTHVLRAAEAGLASSKPIFNPYKARKPWPPDFSKLDPKYQFRLERRYRRRQKLKYLRPGWVKGVKLAQWGICLSRLAVSIVLIVLVAVFTYGVLFMDLGENDNNFATIRDWFKNQSSSIWTSSIEQPPAQALNDVGTGPHATNTA
ncbi:MAG: hypothetical protein Q9181_002891 [Wetmoreana brouardii]